ncbi:MAG: DUF4150 domain-containing protein [Deltaproteobacteria bacterium]|nr:DUF4150 domain-containing protein [Deltaproteobacteria bacterium]
MFANSQMMGMDSGSPDVCLTPSPAGPIPVPYPNIANGTMGVGAVYHVLFMSSPAHNMGTTIPLTNGDNAGVAAGVASGTVMGPSKHTTGANSVLIGGMPATRVGSTSLQNSTNCPGARVAPSQTKVLLLAP